MFFLSCAEPFFDELNRLGVEFEALDMVGVSANLKAFLKLRDTHSAFNIAKQNGSIGIPALVLEDGEVLLDKNKLADIFA